MNPPEDRRYLETHEWHKLDGDQVIIGITQIAADELTDITYVALPPVGKKLNAGDAFGEIESVKATADLMCGVSGEVTAVNNQLRSEPGLVNQSPYDKGWMIRVRLENPAHLETLLDAAAYQAKHPRD